MQNDIRDDTDEGIPAAQFDAEERDDEDSFGSWPELVGLVAVILITIMILEVTG